MRTFLNILYYVVGVLLVIAIVNWLFGVDTFSDVPKGELRVGYSFVFVVLMGVFIIVSEVYDYNPKNANRVKFINMLLGVNP